MRDYVTIFGKLTLLLLLLGFGSGHAQDECQIDIIDPDGIFRKRARFPWAPIPNTIPGFPDDLGQRYEKRQLARTQGVYRSLANPESASDTPIAVAKQTFPIAMEDERISKMVTELFAERHNLGNLSELETMMYPQFAEAPASFLHVGNQVALLFNLNHWEQAPNLTFCQMVHELYVWDRLIHHEYLQTLRSRVKRETLNTIYESLEGRKAADRSFRTRDKLEQLFSWIYGEVARLKAYAEWTTVDYVEMKTARLEQKYRDYRKNPKGYLRSAVIDHFYAEHKEDPILAPKIEAAVDNLLSLPIPPAWLSHRIPR